MPPERDGGRGHIDIGIVMKVKSWSDVEYEDDVGKLIGYRRATSVQLRYGIELDAAGKREEWFDADRDSTVWAFVVMGQVASAVADPSVMLSKMGREAEGIVAACLVARSKRNNEIEDAPCYWVHVLGERKPRCRMPIR